MNKARGYGLSAELERKVRKDQNTCKNVTKLKLWIYTERNVSLKARMAVDRVPNFFDLFFAGK